MVCSSLCPVVMPLDDMQVQGRAFQGCAHTMCVVIVVASGKQNPCSAHVAPCCVPAHNSVPMPKCTACCKELGKHPPPCISTQHPRNTHVFVDEASRQAGLPWRSEAVREGSGLPLQCIALRHQLPQLGLASIHVDRHDAAMRGCAFSQAAPWTQQVHMKVWHAKLVQISGGLVES